MSGKPELSIVHSQDDPMKPESEVSRPADVTAALRLLDDNDRVKALLPTLAELPEDLLAELALALADLVSCETKSNIALALFGGLPHVDQLEFVSEVQFGQPSLMVAWDRANNATRAELIATRIAPPVPTAPKEANKFHPSTLDYSRHDLRQGLNDLEGVITAFVQRTGRYGRHSQEQQFAFENEISLIVRQILWAVGERVARTEDVSEVERRRLKWQNATDTERSCWRKCNDLATSERWQAFAAECERESDRGFRLSANPRSQLGRLSRSGEGE